MSIYQNIVEEMDNEIQACTGGIPPEYNVEEMFRETKEYQRKLFGGGAENVIEKEWLEGLMQRQASIKHRKAEMMEEIEEVEEIEESEELNELERDGIFLKR